MTATPVNFDFLPALPEITLLVAACVVLMVDLVLPETLRKWSYWLTQLGVVATAWLSLYVFHQSPAHTFGNTFVADALADVLKFLSCMTVALTLAYSRSYLTVRGLFLHPVRDIYDRHTRGTKLPDQRKQCIGLAL
ncbi:MAG TPA: hypothetical protein VN744_12190 [Casimicrobiaceae bacterium]|nr:hypothetical protein [Casimicrobiaceae bacterium]